MKLLLIGGPADGKWMDIQPGLDHVVVPEVKPLKVSVTCEYMETLKEVRYVRELLVSKNGDRRYVMCALNDGEDLIERLINGYQP